MRFFSKLVFLCNICFLMAVGIRYLQYSEVHHANYKNIGIFKPIESTLVILGYGAVLFNFIICCVVLFNLITKERIKSSKILNWINFLILLVQIYYFFYSEF